MVTSIGAGVGPEKPAAGEGPTRTVVISWVEHSHHEVAVRVPLAADLDACDLENGLAALSDDGFEYVERSVSDVRDVEFDPKAEFFDPPSYAGRSA